MEKYEIKLDISICLIAGICVAAKYAKTIPGNKI